MGYCVTGYVVTGRNQTQERAIYYSSHPKITYSSSPADEAYWGTTYTTLDDYWSFAPGYRVFQSDEAGCQLGKDNENEDGSKYDCLNTSCVKADQFGTPGAFASLEECEKNCGPGCSGKCISNGEWAQIEGLAGQLKNKNCS